MKEMQYIEIPKFPVYQGEKAIIFLRDFIKELEENRSEELTVKQATTLIKIAKGLISSIEAEVCTEKKPRRRFKFLNKNIAN